MAAQIITAAAELDLLPVGSVILDAEGCAWQKWDDTERCDDGGDRLPVVWASTAYTDDWTSEELATKTMGLMGRPVGPFRLTYRPDAESEPQRVQPSRDDVARVLFDLSGTCATYGEQADAILALCAAQPTVAEVQGRPGPPDATGRHRRRDGSPAMTVLRVVGRALLWPVAMLCLLGAGLLDAIEGDREEGRS